MSPNSYAHRPISLHQQQGQVPSFAPTFKQFWRLATFNCKKVYSPLENRYSVSHSIFTYPSLNVSDAASKRPSMPDNRVASGTKLIPTRLFRCSKLGRHQRFSRHYVKWFPGWSPTDFLFVTGQSYCPVTRLSPSMLESAHHFLVLGAGYPKMLSFFVIAMDMFVKTLTSREDPLFSPFVIADNLVSILSSIGSHQQQSQRS